MKRRLLAGVSAAVLLAGALTALESGVAGAASCRSTNRPSYTVNVCISAPANGAVVSGLTPVSANATFTGTSPGVQRLTFYLDGDYVLTDFKAPGDFTLPTAKFADGSHLLEVETLLRDGYTTPRTSITLNFSNGNATAPVNTGTFTPSTGRPAAPGEPFKVAFVGDGGDGLADTATVANQLASDNPNLFLFLGDLYEKGSMSEYFNYYAPTFGPLRSVTNPTIGNHEFENGQALGYFDYWDNIPSYYSYNANGWHFISLNSTGVMDSTAVGSAQYQWLQNDLVANASNPCTVVYFHHPVLSVGPQGGTPRMQAMWSLLSQHGVDLVLTGHDHSYQRWTPLNGAFSPSADGIPQFVVGGGGHGIQKFVTGDSRLAVGIDTAPSGFGPVELTLNPAGGEFAFQSNSGSVLDSGVVACHGPGTGPDQTAPTAPTGLSAVASSSTTVDLTWSAATDNVGVNGYTIYRNGTGIGTVNGATRSFSDSTAQSGATYTYRVDAVDLTGNHSPLSNAATLQIPGGSSAPVTVNPVADSYVDAANPTVNYGALTQLRTDSPDISSYLRFDVSTLSRPVVSAKLRIGALSSLTAGYTVRSVANTSWSETGITASNAPPVGSALGTSGPAVVGGYNEIDVTAAVTGNGSYSFALTPLSTTNLKLGSRESTSKPELVIETAPAGSDPPVAGDVTISGNAGTVLNWAPSVSDPNGGALTCSISSPPGHGTAAVATDCSSGTYTPTPGYSGADSFQYQVSDGLLTDTGTVSATVNPVFVPQTIVGAAADSYVDSSNPGLNYGTQTQLRLDSSPDVRSYVRFSVPCSAGSISSVVLRLSASSSLTAGYEVRRVTNNGWVETGITYANAPAVGTSLGSSGPALTGAYNSVDVTAAVTSCGTYSFALTPLSSTALKLASRETPTPPQLVVNWTP